MSEQQDIKVSEDLSGDTIITIPQSRGQLLKEKRQAIFLVGSLFLPLLAWWIWNAAYSSTRELIVASIGSAGILVGLPFFFHWMFSRMDVRHYRLRIGSKSLSAEVDPAKPDLRFATLKRQDLIDVHLLRVFASVGSKPVIAWKDQDRALQRWLPLPFAKGKNNLTPWRKGIAAVREALKSAPTPPPSIRPVTDSEIRLPTSGITGAFLFGGVAIALLALLLGSLVSLILLIAWLGGGFDSAISDKTTKADALCNIWGAILAIGGLVGFVYLVFTGLGLLLTLPAARHIRITASELTILSRLGREIVTIAPRDIVDVHIAPSRLIGNEGRRKKWPLRLVVELASDAGECLVIDIVRLLRRLKPEEAEPFAHQLRQSLGLAKPTSNDN